MEKEAIIQENEFSFNILQLSGISFFFHFFHFLLINFIQIGQGEFVKMLPLVCYDAMAILFMFDLNRQPSINSIKEWYRFARFFNKVISFFGNIIHTSHIDIRLQFLS